MPQAIVTCTDLQKDFGDFALGPISIELFEGETVGLMGKNGAGKTTLFQLLTGNLDASSGEIHIDEVRMLPEQFLLKRRIGYLPQHMYLPPWATGYELLNYAAQLHEIQDPDKRLEQLTQQFDCKDFLHIPIAKCSHGMQKRIGLAIACMHKPDFLILDEPFSGLDIFHIQALKLEIQSRQDSGLSTLICTHIAPYAAKLCQRMLVMERGSLTTCDSWDSKNQIERIDWIENFFFQEGSNI